MEISLSPQIASIAFQNTRDGIIITDTSSQILFVNQAFMDVTGYSEKEVLGGNPSILKSGKHDATFFMALWESLRQRGHWEGEIWDRRKNGEVFLEYLSISALKDDQGEVSHYIGVFTDIQHKYESNKQLDYAVRYDILTDLPNRNQIVHYLKKNLSSSRRKHKLLAVALLDLDNFKKLNDHNGHALGDRLLVVIAQRLQSLVRNSDMVGRLGGDEFALILPDLDNISEVTKMTQRLLGLVASPIEVDGQKYQLTTSIGITLFPFDDADAEMLLRHADQAMYKAKDNGKNQCHLFDIEKDQQAQTRRELLPQLKTALEQDELVLYYQPKVNMRTGEVFGAEALIRWQHPKEGLLPPGNFLPHIENHELIIEIGNWVIHQALSQLSKWIDQGLNLTISVNIAARQLLQQDFVANLQSILKCYPDVPAQLLDLEILESSALENTEHVENVIRECHKLGVCFSLDDFGTGYASLSYLRDIPADTLKIDQSFVFNLLKKRKDLTLVEAIVGLATAFQRKVIAEGVETTEHGVLLMRLGCDLAQGYGIAKPMPAEQLPDWIMQYKPDEEWALWADTSWELGDFPLLVALHDHVNWVRNILMYLEEEERGKVKQQIIIDHQQCRFGHWYYNVGAQRYGNLKEFVELEATHITIHQMGHQIISLCDKGQRTEAQQISEQLVNLKEKMLTNLAELQRKVAHKIVN